MAGKPGMHKKNPRRRFFKVTRMPEEVKDAIDSLLADGVSYEAIANQVKAMGQSVSYEAIRNYHRFIEEQSAKANQFEVLWKRFERTEPGIAIEDGLLRTLCTVAADMLVDLKRINFIDDDGVMTTTDFNSLVRALTRIQAVRVQMDTYRIKVQDRAEVAAKEIEDSLSGTEGISLHTMRLIKSKILGIAEVKEEFND